jgi:hypothetical protein
MGTNGKKKNAASVDGAARGTYTIELVPQYETMLATAKLQSSIIKECPDYTNQPLIQAAVSEMDGAVVQLGTTLGKLAAIEVEKQDLETQRTLDAALLHRTHGGVAVAVNKVCAGQRKLLEAYGAAVGRAVLPPLGTEAPTKVTAKSPLGTFSVVFQAQREKRFTCYHFQWGFDMTNPDAWPNHAVEGGCKHTVTGLTVGQKVYGRIAVQRPKVGVGAWSDIITVTVR